MQRRFHFPRPTHPIFTEPRFAKIGRACCPQRAASVTKISTDMIRAYATLLVTPRVLDCDCRFPFSRESHPVKTRGLEWQTTGGARRFARAAKRTKIIQKQTASNVRTASEVRFAFWSACGFRRFGPFTSKMTIIPVTHRTLPALQQTVRQLPILFRPQQRESIRHSPSNNICSQ